MAQYALTPAGLVLDAFALPGGDWRDLADATRARTEPLILTCGQCRIRLRTRDPGVRARRHFVHEASAPRSCTNTAGEGETPAHRTLAGVLVDAYSSVPGIEAAKEQIMPAGDEMIRVDVLARRGLVPVSAAEVQLSYQPAAEIRRRNRQRRQALESVMAAETARTTPWFANRAVEAWYQTVPILWTTLDGQKVTDGIYLPARHGGGDLDAPIELDIDQVAARLVSGALVEIDLGDEAYWLDRSSIIDRAKVRRGRRRYKAKLTDLGPLAPCDRVPIVEPTPETRPLSPWQLSHDDVVIRELTRMLAGDAVPDGIPCSRCGAARAERFPGPCPDCWADLLDDDARRINRDRTIGIYSAEIVPPVVAARAEVERMARLRVEVDDAAARPLKLFTFCPVPTCGLTATDGSDYCWRHTGR